LRFLKKFKEYHDIWSYNNSITLHSFLEIFYSLRDLEKKNKPFPPLLSSPIYPSQTDSKVTGGFAPWFGNHHKRNCS